MKIHTRSDSAVYGATVRVQTIDGANSRMTRSLGVRDEERACRIAPALQKLADEIHDPLWERLRRNIEDVFIAAGYPIPIIVKDRLPALILLGSFADDYLGRKKPKVSLSHHALLKRCLRGFVRQHKGLEIVQVKGLHVQAWLDGLLSSGIAAGSALNQLSALSSMFKYAVDLGHISANPCSGVDVPAAAPSVLRQPMEDADFEKLVAYLEASGETEWCLMARLGKFAGLRLMDASRLKCSDVIVKGDAVFISFVVGKTDKPITIPVFPPLAASLKGYALRSGPLLPALCRLTASALSKQFSGLVAGAGIDQLPVKLANGRVANQVTFHSLRHSNRVWLARLGLPARLSMRLMGHASESVHEGYNHEDADSLMRELEPYFKAGAEH